MTKKSRRESLRESLSEVTRPPEPSPKLDEILGRYATGTPILAPAPARPVDVPPEEITPAEIPAPAELITAPEDLAPAEIASAPAIAPAQPLQSSAPEDFSPPEAFAHPEQHTRVPNELLDRLLPTLKTSEQSVLLRLYRLTWGFQKDTCHVSMKKLGKACNLSARQVTTCVQALERRGLVKRVNVDLDNRNQDERGVTYRILLPSTARAKFTAPAKISPAANFSAGAETADNKRKDLKGNNKKGINRLTPEEIESFAATVADLLGEGKAIEEIAPRFAPNMHGADWAAVRGLAQASVKR